MTEPSMIAYNPVTQGCSYPGCGTQDTSFLDGRHGRRCVKHPPRETPWHPPTLTVSRQVVISARQADVLAGICHGHQNAEIGRRLFLTEDTVKTHCRRLMAALGADNRTHAAALVCSGQVIVLVSEPERRAA